MRRLASNKKNNRSDEFSDDNINYPQQLNEYELPRPATYGGKSRFVISWVFLGAVTTTFVIMGFLVSHYETKQQLKDDLQKNDLSIHNLKEQITELNMQIKAGSVGPNNRLDYAQHSQGAKVLKFQGVEIQTDSTIIDRVKQFFGLYVARGACRVLGHKLNKNTFLAFKGSKAALTIKLNQRIFLDTIRIEHYIDDLGNPNVISAMPKDFSVYGYRDDSTDPIPIGQLTINLNPNTKRQSAMVHFHPKESYEIYKVEIISNHGNSDLTKLYKIRMYGQVDDQD